MLDVQGRIRIRKHEIVTEEREFAQTKSQTFVAYCDRAAELQARMITAGISTGSLVENVILGLAQPFQTDICEQLTRLAYDSGVNMAMQEVLSYIRQYSRLNPDRTVQRTALRSQLPAAAPNSTAIFVLAQATCSETVSRKRPTKRLCDPHHEVIRRNLQQLLLYAMALTMKAWRWLRYIQMAESCCTILAVLTTSSITVVTSTISGRPQCNACAWVATSHMLSRGRAPQCCSVAR